MFNFKEIQKFIFENTLQFSKSSHSKITVYVYIINNLWHNSTLY